MAEWNFLLSSLKRTIYDETSNSSMCLLYNLPKEILFLILRYFCVHDFSQFELASRHAHLMCMAYFQKKSYYIMHIGEDKLILSDAKIIAYLMKRPELTFHKGYTLYLNAFMVRYIGANFSLLKARCSCALECHSYIHFDHFNLMRKTFVNYNKFMIPHWFYTSNSAIMDEVTLNEPGNMWTLRNEEFGYELTRSSEDTLIATNLASGQTYCMSKQIPPHTALV